MPEYTVTATNATPQTTPEFEGIIQKIIVTSVSAGNTVAAVLSDASGDAFNKAGMNSITTVVIPRHITTDGAGNEDTTPGDVGFAHWFHIGRLTLTLTPGGGWTGSVIARIFTLEA